VINRGPSYQTEPSQWRMTPGSPTMYTVDRPVHRTAQSTSVSPVVAIEGPGSSVQP
jgi:hypothetical protein